MDGTVMADADPPSAGSDAGITTSSCSCPVRGAALRDIRSAVTPLAVASVAPSGGRQEL
jgi:hypothetical protein